MSATRRAIVAIGVGVVLGAAPVIAQTPTKVATIGVLQLAPRTSAPWALEALRKGLAEHGWVEERTFRIVMLTIPQAILTRADQLIE